MRSSESALDETSPPAARDWRCCLGGRGGARRTADHRLSLPGAARCSTPTRLTRAGRPRTAAAARSKARRSPSSRRPSPRPAGRYAAASGRRRAPPTPRSTPASSARATATRARILEDELRREEAKLAEMQQGIQQRRARAPRRRAQLPEVPRPRGRDEGRDRAQGERRRRPASASWPSCRRSSSRAAAAAPVPGGACDGRTCPPTRAGGLRPAGHDGGRGARRRPLPARQRHASRTLLGLSRRALLRGNAARLARRPAAAARDAGCRGRATDIATGRFDAQMRAAPAAATRAAAGARHRQPDRRPGARAGRDDRDRAADAPGPRGAHARPGPGQQGTGAQPGARDQEPARRHPRRGAAAGDGARSQARADRVHPGHHPRGRPPAGAGRPPAGAAPPAARGGRRQHPRGLRARAFADRWPNTRAAWRCGATTTPRFPSSAATASS